MTSRRDFARAALLAAMAARCRGARLQSIGLQLYTVRNILPQRPAEVLEAIRAIGYREIEATWDNYASIRPMVEASGLKAVSIHIDNRLMSKDAAEMERVANQAKAWGFGYAVYPYVPVEERKGADGMKLLAGRLNLFGEKCRAAGVQAGYHNHAFESAPAGGQTLFEILIANTEPRLVQFELDCFWLSVAGIDPAAFLRKLKGRVRLLHLKDEARGTGQRFNESVPASAFESVGHGVLDWPVILHAAAEAGVAHYFVEQDQTPGDPLASIRESYDYLSKLTF